MVASPEGYSGTRVDVYRIRIIQVDATTRPGSPGTGPRPWGGRSGDPGRNPQRHDYSGSALSPLKYWYHQAMTTVEILFKYATPPSEAAVFALASTKDVYGIRRLSFDREARTLRIEYDAT